MGLAERRLAEALKTTTIPAFLQKIEQLAGFPIVLEIDWETFTAFDEYPLTRLQNYFDEIETALADICRDELGKEALRKHLHTISLVNTDQQEAVKMDLVDQVLHLTVQFAGSTFSHYGSTDLIKYLEKRL